MGITTPSPLPAICRPTSGHKNAPAQNDGNALLRAMGCVSSEHQEWGVLQIPGAWIGTEGELRKRQSVAAIVSMPSACATAAART